jgi:flagellin
VANTEAAKSRIEDADFAVETTQLTRNTVLQQAATSMVAQANASKNSILALIQG